MQTRMGLIGKGEEGLREVVSAAEGLLETLYNATADPAFWRVPVPSYHTAQRAGSAGPGAASQAEREPLAATIEAAHLRYRAASNALKDVLTELDGRQKGVGRSGDEGAAENEGPQKEGAEKEAAEGQETDGVAAAKEAPAEQGTEKDATEEEEEVRGDAEEAPTEAKAEGDAEHEAASPKDVEMKESGSGEGDEREPDGKFPGEEVQKEADGAAPQMDVAALRARRDSLRRRVAAKNATLDALAAKLEGIIDAVTLWQSVGLVHPPPLDFLER